MTGRSKCLTCNHPNVLEIDRALAQGKTNASISREYGVPENSLRVHKENHLSKKLAAAWKRSEVMESMNIMSDIEDLVKRTKTILDRAESKKQYGIALAAIREARGTYELMVKIAAYWHETRRDELENERTQMEKEHAAESEKAFEKAVEILNESERSMFRRLYMKIISQDPNMVVIPDKKKDKSPVVRLKRKESIAPIVEEEISEYSSPDAEEIEEIDDSLRVRPINSTPIPGTEGKKPRLRLK